MDFPDFGKVLTAATDIIFLDGYRAQGSKFPGLVEWPVLTRHSIAYPGYPRGKARFAHRCRAALELRVHGPVRKSVERPFGSHMPLSHDRDNCSHWIRFGPHANRMFAQNADSLLLTADGSNPWLRRMGGLRTGKVKTSYAPHG